ncbi:MAG: OmpH family outer membrane protein [Abditibacteriota bacterium]|nr:OmpH family outer membrane protein [Abditibacteriota bacterium]
MKTTKFVIASLLLMLAAASSFAQDASKVGVIDSAKVIAEAPRFKQYQEEVEALYKDLSLKLDVRSQNLMLTDAEVKELIDLKAKAEPTDAEKARMAELTQIENGRDAELKELQSTAELKDDKKARLKELQDIEQQSKDTGKALAEDYENQLRTKQNDIQAQVEKDMVEAATKIAGEKGLTLILLKNSVVFGGVDITEDMIKALDRKS